MKVRIVVEHIIEVPNSEAVGDLEDFRDSLQDDYLDAQESTHETSDGKFEYIPGPFEIIIFEQVK
jgi:hypothetical protein